MEHPCHSCGKAVEDGVLFCRNCGAPQIRVTASASDPEVQPSEGFSFDQDQFHPSRAYGRFGSSINWSDALRVAVLCGLLEALFSLFGLGLIAGGALSVALYRRRVKTPITTAMGARLGAIAGGMGWLFVTLITSAGSLVFRSGSQIRLMILDSMEKAAARNPSPQAQELLQYARTEDGFAVILLAIFIMTLILFLVLSTLGGMLGSALFNRRHQ